MAPDSKRSRRMDKKSSRLQISDQELTSLSVPALNRLLSGRPPAEVRVLKHRRRTLKNRGYATNCRVKRLTQKEILEHERNIILDESEELEDINEELKNEIEETRKQHQALLDLVKARALDTVKVEPPDDD